LRLENSQILQGQVLLNAATKPEVLLIFLLHWNRPRTIADLRCVLVSLIF
jgi:hypothetical protein